MTIIHILQLIIYEFFKIRKEKLSRIFIFIASIILFVNLSFSQDSEAIISEMKEDSAKVEYLLNASRKYKYDNELAVEYAKNAESLSLDINYWLGIHKANKRLSEIFQKRGQFDQAIRYEENALLTAEYYDLIPQAIQTYKSISELYDKSNISQGVIENYFKGLEYTKSKKIKKEEANFNLLIANYYSKLKDFQEALIYYQNATTLFHSLDLKNKKALSVLGLGKSYFHINDLEKSSVFLDSSLALKNNFKNQNHIALVYTYMGKLYHTMKDGKLAYVYFSKAILNVDQKDQYYTALIYSEFGEFLKDKNEFKKARKYLNTAYETASSISENFVLLEILKSMSELNYKLGQYKKAFEINQEYNQLKDKIYNLQKSNIISKFKNKEKEDEKRQYRLVQDIEVYEESQKQLKSQTLILFAVLFLIAVILAVLYYRFRLNQKQRKLLQDKNNEIMEQKAQLEELNDILTARNEEIGNINQNLEESKIDLQRSNATKDKFFSIIAHDLKNPIAGLMLSADLIITYFDKFTKDKLIKKLDEIRISSIEINNLVINLLDWARQQSGRIEYTPTDVDISDLVKQIEKMFRPNLINKNLTLETDIKEKHKVVADQNMVKTILRNIISNAIKFTPRNGKIVVKSVKSGGFIATRIKDSGIGIPEEVKDKLFIGNNFTTKGTDNEGGTGLGLGLCKEFTEINKGEISVESELGKGTTFVIKLPALKINL